MSLYALADAASAVNLNHPGTYLSWSFIDISVANLVVIGVMGVLFCAALLVRFPCRRDPPAAPRGSGTVAGAGAGSGAEAQPGSAADDPDADMWTNRVRRRALLLLP